MALAALLEGIADAIREKDGTTESIKANQFPEKILALLGGSASEAQAYEGADGLRSLFGNIAASIRTLDGTTAGIAANDFPERIRAIQIREETVVFTESTDWTVPAGITHIYGICVGGGGGGGGRGGFGGSYSAYQYNGAFGRGGGHGEILEQWLSVQPGASLSITIGAGGIGGDPGNTVSAGSAGYRGNRGSNGSAGEESKIGDLLSSTGGYGGAGGLGATPYAHGSPQYALDGEKGYQYDSKWYGSGGDSSYPGKPGIVIVKYRLLVH